MEHDNLATGRRRSSAPDTEGDLTGRTAKPGGASRPGDLFEASAPAPRLLDPTTVEAVPWRNGAGTTRELAAMLCPDGQPLWRVSVGELPEDAAFSVYPEVDRVFVALGAMVLVIDAMSVRLAAGEQVRFPGEATVMVKPERPTRALNVMTRRGLCRAEVGVRPAREAPSAGADLIVELGDLRADIHLATCQDPGQPR